MEIKKMKRRLIVKIIVTIAFLFWSSVFWDNLHLDNYKAYAAANAKRSFIMFDIDSDQPFTLNNINNISNHDNGIKLSVSNDTYLNGYYEIALKIDKNIKYDNLYLQVDKSVNNFKELLVKQDELYNYFIIASNELYGNERIYDISFYADPESMEYYARNSFDVEFVDLHANEVL